jgi:uncharacterized protein YlzI (FlbEa/FlbD family)
MIIIKLLVNEVVNRLAEYKRSLGGVILAILPSTIIADKVV